MSINDWAQMEAFDDGWQKGWEQARKETRELIIKKMKILGYTEQEIQRVIQ